MKQLLILLLVTSTAMMGCKGKFKDCDKPVSNDEYIGFMAHGELLSGKPDGLWIVHIVDPKSWIGNEYFTGKGFSTNKNDALNALEKDSCDLKEAYFNYLKNKP